MSEGIPNGNQEQMGDLESMQSFEAILTYAQEATVSEDEAVEFLASQLKEMKNSQHAAHYLDKIDPDQHYSETKTLSENAKERLRKAFVKLT